MADHQASDDPKSPFLPLHDHQIQHSPPPSSHNSLLNSILTPANFYILLGPLFCTLIFLCVKPKGPVTGRNMLADLAWVFEWWLTDAVSMPITSMSPLFLFPLFGISSADGVAHSYMDDVIALVLGSFILALAVEHYNIHRRLSLNVLMATLLFIIPSKKQKGEKLMDWNKCKKLPWNIVLLMGAGFAIADGVRTNGLADVLSRTSDFLGSAPYLAIAPTVRLISAIITEFTSNNATAIPLLSQIAKTMHVHPLLLMVPWSSWSTICYLAINRNPFTTGHIDIPDMIKTGFPLKIAGLQRDRF